MFSNVIKSVNSGAAAAEIANSGVNKKASACAPVACVNPSQFK